MANSAPVATRRRPDVPASMAARISSRWESGSGIDGVILLHKLQISTP